MDLVEDLAEACLHDLHDFVLETQGIKLEIDFHIPSIINSISQEEIDNFQPMHKRYYEEKYCSRFSTETENLDTCVKVHTNRVCVIYLSSKHSIVTRQQRIDQFNFQVHSQLDRTAIKLSGKRKKGALRLEPETILCYAECGDEKYPIRAGIHGKLLEINEEITRNPNLAINDLQCDGFIAIILPDLSKIEKDLAQLLSREQYFN